MFLAKENLPQPSRNILRENGFSVKSIREEVSGVSDSEVIKIALELNLIILTFDSDYGELIFRYSLNNPPSVVFFRDKGNNPEFAGKTLLRLIQNNPIQLSNAFTVVESNSVRQRFYS